MRWWIGLLCCCRSDLAAAFTEADAAETVTLAVRLHDDFVAVFEEATLFAGGELDRRAVGGGRDLRRGGEGVAVPREFEEAAAVFSLRAADGAGGHEVAGLDEAAVGRVVGEHLGNGPV